MTATPGSAALLALADRIEREKHALDHMDDGQPEGLGPTEAAFFDTMDENAAVIIDALRLAAKSDDAVRLAAERLRQFASVFDGDAYADEGEPNMREDIEIVCSAAESVAPVPSPTSAILSKHLTKDIADHILREWADALHPIIRKYAGVEMLDGIWQELQEARRALLVPSFVTPTGGKVKQ